MSLTPNTPKLSVSTLVSHNCSIIVVPSYSQALALSGAPPVFLTRSRMITCQPVSTPGSVIVSNLTSKASVVPFALA
jgi:hypothetical protein